MKVGINRSIIGKLINSPANNHAWTYDWKDEDVSLLRLVTLVANGYGFGPQFTKGHRKDQNFIKTQVLAVDIDRGWTKEELSQNDLVQKYAAFIYATPSHTPENPRFRIVFELDFPILSCKRAKDALTTLVALFGGRAGTAEA